MQSKVEDLKKSTIKIHITVPAEDVKKAYDKTLKKFAEDTELPGFRKGQAPTKLVEEKSDQGELNGEVVNNLLRTYYPQALKEHHISPVSNPNVEIKEYEKDKDFIFEATVAVRPEIKMGDYKKALKKFYENKKKEFEKQRKEAEKEDSDKKPEMEGAHHDHVHLSTNEIIQVLIDNSDMEISELLINEETDRMLSRLISQAEQLGMTLDQYLNSQNKSAKDLRKEYNDIAENNLRAEFIMNHLVKEEGIETSDEEIDNMIEASGDPSLKEKMNDEVQRWYIKSILEKNKLLQSLASDIEGDLHHEK